MRFSDRLRRIARQSLLISILLPVTTVATADPALPWLSEGGLSQMAVQIIDGRCERQAIGTAIGGALGGAIGSQVGDGGGRLLATVAGSVIGAVIGNRIGKLLDDSDQSCLQQTLEYGRDGMLVAWDDPNLDRHYEVTPLRTYADNDRYCRDFLTRTVVTDTVDRQQASACRSVDGNWQQVN